MEHCFVEFGTYGTIGDFEIEEEMTKEQIFEQVEEIIHEFVVQESGYVIVDNIEDYW